VRIGVLSDTHIPHRLPQLPPTVVETFADAAVDLILHAGDVDDPRCLEPLGRVAPVIAVRGNVHLQDFSRGGAELPSHVALTCCGRCLVVVHGHRPGLVGFLGRTVAVAALKADVLTRERINGHIARRLRRRFTWADVVVFGHTHEAFETWLGGTFFLNPGAVVPEKDLVPSVAILTLGCETLESRIVSLSL
jgi:putative phosphoesterase